MKRNQGHFFCGDTKKKTEREDEKKRKGKEDVETDPSFRALLFNAEKTETGSGRTPQKPKRNPKVEQNERGREI